MEVMVALVILTVGLMSIALLMANVYKSTVRSRYVSLAATLASEKLEDLNSYSPSDYRGKLAGGSLTADIGPVSQTWNTYTEYVNYYDTVTLNSNTTTGAMTETTEILAADGVTKEYITQTFTPDGLLHWDSVDGNPPTTPYYPSKPTTTPPVGITFDRRWVIENNTPVTGLNRITVLVTLTDLAITPAGTQPINFQMSMVRP